LTQSNSNGTEVKVNYVSVGLATWTSFVTTFKSAKDLSANDIETGIQVFVTLAGFAVVTALSSVLSYYFDLIHQTEELQKHQRKNFSTKVKKQNQVSSQQGDVSNKEVTDPIDFLTMAEEALPEVLSSKSIWSRIVKEVKSHHRWFGVIFHYSRVLPRALRIVSLASNIVIMLFIQSITYNLTHGDDGTCKTFDQEGDCLEPKSAYSTGSSMCYWQRSDETCHYIEPDNDLKVMIYVAIFSAIATTPLAVLLDWLIMNVLVAPTRHNREPAKQTQIDIIPGVQTETVVAVSRQKRRNSRLNTFLNSQRSIYELIAKREFNQLTDDLRLYRQQMNLGEKREFDGKSQLNAFNQTFVILVCFSFSGLGLR
jgi:hypothetical protein